MRVARGKVLVSMVDTVSPGGIIAGNASELQAKVLVVGEGDLVGNGKFHADPESEPGDVVYLSNRYRPEGEIQFRGEKAFFYPQAAILGAV